MQITHFIFSAAVVAAAAMVATGRTISDGATAAATGHNSLSKEEKTEGWELLFNGENSAGWRGVKKASFPKKGWEIHDGILTLRAKSGAGDIVTTKTYSSFELQLEFRLTPHANSGVKYFIQTDTDKNPGIGPEFQLYDDKRPNARNDGTNYYEIGSLYNLIPASKDKPVLGAGVWRKARIVVRGVEVEHWLDGVKTVSYNRRSPEFRALVAKTKFKNVANYGEWASGHILLQDHGNEVSFRSIKIRALRHP
ncbi:MAG: DUF1080 domain-containing protein [Puniceicoccales bacterium]|nr:DUF1080 domain-containing protein [Puniceicoccales bacterium]